MENQRTRLNKAGFKSTTLSFLSLRKLLGNLLIGGSLCLFLVIYLPIIKAYLPRPSYPQIITSDSSIYIPKINAKAPLIDNVDPWNETEYRQALKNGVAIAKGFAKPGQSGTTFIFAHSSDSPWRISSYNTVFFRLGELKQGDEIEINFEGNISKYEVLYSIDVWPGEVEAITKSRDDTLILQTCTPVGTSLKRLLVFANPVAKENPR